MGSFGEGIEDWVRTLVRMGDTIVDSTDAIEFWLRDQLENMGMAPTLQTLALMALSAMLIVVAMRLFGGVVRVALVVVVTLFVVHVLLPILKT